MKKKKRKGFTLIELLAVVVILSVLFIMGIPSVLNSIKNSKKSSFVNYAVKMLNSAEAKYHSDLLLGLSDSDSVCYSINSLIDDHSENTYKGYVIVWQDEINDDVVYSLSMTTNKYSIFSANYEAIDEVKENLDLDKADLSITNECPEDWDKGDDIRYYLKNPTSITYLTSKRTPTIKERLKVGDIIKIQSEEFYVLPIDEYGETRDSNGRIHAIAKYNLLIGNICSSTSTCQDYLNVYNSQGYGFQNAKAMGRPTKDEWPAGGRIGTISFGTNNTYEGSVAEGIVNDYIARLKPMIDENIEITGDLITTDELELLDCKIYNISGVCDRAQAWIYDTGSYWTKTSVSFEGSSQPQLWAVYLGGNIHPGFATSKYSFGIRPVIIIK